MITGVPMLFGGVAAPAGDPYFNMVKLLLHAEGTNGSTTFTDSSPSPQTATAVGNAQISTARASSGDSSILLDGTGDAVSLPNAGRFNPGSSAFCVEGKAYCAASSLSGIKFLLSTRSDSGLDYGLFVYISANRTMTATVMSNSVSQNLVSSATIAFNTWFHWAFTYDGVTYRTFLDGVLAASTVRVYLVPDSNGLCRIGSSSLESGTRNWPGNQDEVRFTIGAARYTTNFTPPTEPFPDF